MRNRKDSDPEAVQPRGEIGIIPHGRGREGRVGETYLQNETKSTLMAHGFLSLLHFTHYSAN